MQDSSNLLTLVFLGLAVFVIWRLRSVLGQRTGAERPPTAPVERRGAPMAKDGRNVIPLPGAANDRVSRPAEPADPDRWKGFAAPGTPLAASFDAIEAAAPGFDLVQFIQGARGAYEMIVTSFAAGDRKTLKDLLARDVFDGFVKAITDREARGEKVETTFVSIDKAEILEAQLRGSSAQITVKFVSKLITATRDKLGVVVDGAVEKVADVTDVWTFSRDLKSREPNWYLIATEAGS